MLTIKAKTTMHFVGHRFTEPSNLVFSHFFSVGRVQNGKHYQPQQKTSNLGLKYFFFK